MKKQDFIYECPRCGLTVNMFEQRLALSRLDNKTGVCSLCGQDEAWEAFTLGRVIDWRTTEKEYEVTFSVKVTYTTKMMLPSCYDDNDDIQGVLTDMVHDNIMNEDTFLSNMCIVIDEEFNIPQDIVVVSK